MFASWHSVSSLPSVFRSRNSVSTQFLTMSNPFGMGDTSEWFLDCPSSSLQGPSLCDSSTSLSLAPANTEFCVFSLGSLPPQRRSGDAVAGQVFVGSLPAQRRLGDAVAGQMFVVIIG